MNSIDIVKAIEAKGGSLTANNGKLIVSAPQALPKQLMQAISDEKPALLIALGQPLNSAVASILDELRPRLTPELRAFSDTKLQALANFHMVHAWNAAARDFPIGRT